MQRYILRRLLLGALTGLLVSLLIFSILRIAPGDVAMMIALRKNESQNVGRRLGRPLGLRPPS